MTISHADAQTARRILAIRAAELSYVPPSSVSSAPKPRASTKKIRRLQGHHLEAT
jgi:hypothetical protein